MYKSKADEIYQSDSDIKPFKTQLLVYVPPSLT